MTQSETLGPFDKVVGNTAQTVIGKGSSLEIIVDFKQENGTDAVDLTGHTAGVHSAKPTSIFNNMTIEHTDRTAGRVTYRVSKEKFENSHVGELKNWFKPMVTFSNGTRKVSPKLYLDQYS